MIMNRNEIESISFSLNSQSDSGTDWIGVILEDTLYTQRPLIF